MKPVLRSCEQSPAIAAITQMIPPMQIAPIIPVVPVTPVDFRTRVAMIRVAIAIPETGLLDEPTRPTIREETVAKKKPNTTTIRAPTRLTGNAGTSQTTTARARTRTSRAGIGRSCSVRRVLEAVWFLLMLCIACAKVRPIRGRFLTRLMIPPAATAPAPMYLM